MKKKELERIKHLLIVVDVVNGFVRKGNLADSRLEESIPEIVRLVDDYYCSNNGIIFIRDAHTLNCAEFDRLQVHCLDGSYESEIIDELKPYEKYAYIYKKNCTSAFMLKEFRRDIALMRQLKEICLIGWCTDICVMNLGIDLRNYFDQINKKVDIIIPSYAVGTYHVQKVHESVEWGNMAFRFMEQAGLRVVKKYERK